MKICESITKFKQYTIKRKTKASFTKSLYEETNALPLDIRKKMILFHGQKIQKGIKNNMQKAQILKIL